MVQKDSIKNKIIIICGPTASSKTALSIELAKILGTEIISADSMNVYKGLNIGTAKPTAEEREGIIHHLIDVISPKETFSVGDYREIALPIVKNLLSRGKTPIICGGTGFYINSILYNYSYGNSGANIEIRDKFMKLADSEGCEFVYNELKKVDPISAEKIHFNDKKRIIRALEIYYSGFKKSDIKDDLTPTFDYSAFTIGVEREILYNRIDERVELMFNNGLENEVKSLLDSGISFSDQCMQGIGYKEFSKFFSGEITLSELKELIKLNTRHYAKRQITFFKKLPNLKTIPLDSVENMANVVMENL